ncbi:MAG: phage tail tape measure protein [Roseovarius confluentis]|jgi:hypothetical protein
MANQRLKATVTIGGVLDRSVKKNIGILRSGLEGVGDEIKTVTDRQKALSKQRRVLEKQGRSVEELDREYEELGRTLDSLRRKQERWERAAAASRRVGQDFNRMTSSLARTGRNAAIAIGAAAGAVFGLANSTATLGDNVAKTADKLGFGIGPLQELRYAAERSGMSVEQFDSSVTAMQKRLGEAAMGKGAARDSLEALGLSAEKLLEMAPEDALGVIADRLQSIEKPADRAAITAGLFSRAGIGMVNMLKDGSDGLNRLRQDGIDVGYALSEDAVRGAEDFKDALLDAQTVVKGLKNTIGSEFMPVVQRSMERFSEWAKTNRDDVAAFAHTTAEGMERALPVVGQLATGMGDIARKVGEVTSKVADMVGGWENFGKILGGVFVAKAVAPVARFAWSLARLGSAVTVLAAPGVLTAVAGGIKAIGLAMAANPIGATITAIALGAGLIISNWETIEPKIRPILDAVGSAFEFAWTNVIEPVVDALKAAPEAIGAAWQTVKESLAGVINWIGAKFEWLANKVMPVIDALRWVKDKAGDIIESVNSAEPSEGSRGRVQRRAKGGEYRPGWRLVGEGGPELEFMNRGGFIATARETRAMADLARRARIDARRTADHLVRGPARASAASSSAASGGASITQHIQIHAAGMSAAEIADEFERRSRIATDGALYDGARGYGQYGGAA